MSHASRETSSVLRICEANSNQTVLTEPGRQRAKGDIHPDTLTDGPQGTVSHHRDGP